MGMLTCGDPTRPSIQRAGNYLATMQEEEGSWREDFITGTGFPCVFYLKYDMYRNNWPLLALAELRQLISRRAVLA
jgi:squalene-hopene/tetraprenyl-beta-curcumene cyclase